MKDLPPPGLDLFDLDEQFASEKIKMAQLTNKCTDDDVEYFVIIGHGSENKLMGIESEPLTSRPYAISTPPGHYSLFSLLGNLNLLYSMKALAKHRPGASFQVALKDRSHTPPGPLPG